MVRRFAAYTFLGLLFLTFACARKPAERRYDLSGRIIAIDARARQMTIEHQDIPGLMKGMTMPFRVKDDWVFRSAHPGDDVSAILVIADDSSYLENVIVTQGANPAPNESGVRLPQVGDPVPDFSFVNQDGKKLTFSQMKGKAVLVTFIYTRCPLPDYCIRMSSNFSTIAKKLKEQSAVYPRTEQLSISFDPEYDTPKVLREYGRNYAGEVDPHFAHWQFVAGTPEETRKAANFFGLSYTPNGTQIVHSLRTVLIGPDGRIAHLFNGNEWKPDDAVEATAASLR